MARILIVGGGCNGRRLAAEMIAEGHAVRITTRTEARRAAIEGTGAECWIGTPADPATVGGALASVTIACWLLGRAAGAPEEVGALHGSCLELFLRRAIDTTVRGFIYEAARATAGGSSGREGERIVRAIAGRNAIPVAVLAADPADARVWMAGTLGAIGSLLDTPLRRASLG